MIPPLLVKLGHLLGAIGTWILDTGVPWLADKLATDWIPAFTGWVADIIPPLLVEMGVMLGKLIGWITTVALPKIGAAMGKLIVAIPAGIAKGLHADSAGGTADRQAIMEELTGQPAKKSGAAAAKKKGATPLSPNAIGPTLAGPVGLAKGGLLLGLNRPTPLLVGEGRGREDVLAVPHSKGGIGGMGGNTFTSVFNGVPLEEAMERAKREQAWRMALIGRR